MSYWLSSTLRSLTTHDSHILDSQYKRYHQMVHISAILLVTAQVGLNSLDLVIPIKPNPNNPIVFSDLHVWHILETAS